MMKGGKKGMHMMTGMTHKGVDMRKGKGMMKGGMKGMDIPVGGSSPAATHHSATDDGRRNDERNERNESANDPCHR